MSTNQEEEVQQQGGGSAPAEEEATALTRLEEHPSGMFASALTNFDQGELRDLYDQLADHYQSHGPIQELLVEKLALTYLRLQRCALAEAEYHVRTWEDRRKLDEGEAAEYKQREEEKMHLSFFRPDQFEKQVKLIAPYDKALTGQLFQLLHELERVKRMEGGSQVPAPVVGHLTIETNNAE